MVSDQLPVITVITPSYNQADYLETTLRSVLDQAYPALEYIVIDGGSTDGSVEIIRRYAERLTYWLSEPDNGQAAAINRGMKQASGEILCWLNSDDFLLPGALRSVGEIFARFPQIAWLSGLDVTADQAGRVLTCRRPVGRFRALIRRGWYHGRSLGFIRQESTFWRRSLWEQAGGCLNEHLHYALDFDLWRRFAAYTDLVTVRAMLAAYRIQPAQKTAQIERYYAEAGIRLPAAARWLTLPLRAAITPLTWKFAPLVEDAGGWQFHPGSFFRELG